MASDVVNPPAGAYHLTVVGNVRRRSPDGSPAAGGGPPPPVSTGYWLATQGGPVFGTGGAGALGGMTVTGTAGPVVSIASTADGRGYWRSPRMAMSRRSATPTITVTHPPKVSSRRTSSPWPVSANGQGYYLLGKDGGLFTFGNAKFTDRSPAWASTSKT